MISLIFDPRNILVCCKLHTSAMVWRLTVGCISIQPHLGVPARYSASNFAAASAGPPRRIVRTPCRWMACAFGSGGGESKGTPTASSEFDQ